MKLTSPAFENNQKIPAEYTCDGANINPPLKFSDVPENTQSFVVTMVDPDIPYSVKQEKEIDVYDHWVVANISPDTREILEKEEPQGVPGLNSNYMPGYYGPCPPDGEHRYIFTLYALDTKLDIKNSITREEVEEEMEGHIIEKAELVGLYSKQ